MMRLLRPAIMTILAGEPVHGYLLAQRLERMALFRDPSPDPTGIYRLLKTMEKEGLVVSHWDLAESGPARRQYGLTARGKACLHRWIETLQDYRNAIGELLDVLRHAGKSGRKRHPRENKP